MTTTKLAAVLFAEIDGFTELTSSNERLAIELLGEWASIALPLVAEHEGKVFDSVADQLLVVFDSALHAVQYALRLHLILKARNATVEPSRAIVPRVGVHLGEIWMDEKRVYGNGVNIAARVLAEAEAGALLVSEDVWRQVSNKLQATFERLESRTLKNIERPIELWRVRTGCERFEEPGSRTGAGAPSGAAAEPRGSGGLRDPRLESCPAGNGPVPGELLSAPSPVSAAGETAGTKALEPAARDAIDRLVEELRAYDAEELEEMAAGSPSGPVAPNPPPPLGAPGAPESGTLTVRFGSKDVGRLVSAIISEASGGAVANALKLAADRLDDDPERLLAMRRKLKKLETRLERLDEGGVFAELSRLDDPARLAALGQAGRAAADAGRAAARAGRIAAAQGRAMGLEAKRLRREASLEARETRLAARQGEAGSEGSRVSVTEEWERMEKTAIADQASGAKSLATGLALGGLCAAAWFWLGPSTWLLAAGIAVGALPFLGGLSKLIRAAVVLRGRKRAGR